MVTFSDGNTVTYGYDASGSKLSVAYTVGSTTAKTEYAGNKVYKNGTLSMILTEEGYITLSGTTPTYHYYLRDHQGNNRVVIDQAGTVLQVNHYYPFGGLFGEGVQTSSQPYRYNGKELDRQLELDLYDYGARHYDAALGRWLTVDPLAEKYCGISPYAYCANNPVRFIDPDGMKFDDYTIDRDGYIKKVKETQDKYDMLYTKEDYNAGKLDKGLKLDKESVESHTILSDLAQDRKDFKGSYAESINKESSFDVFHFAANNSNVEWSISGFGKGKASEYLVGTLHEKDISQASITEKGYNEFNMIFLIHSHPSITGTKGGSYVKDIGGDMHNIVNRYYRFQEKGISPIYMPKEYVYHKYGKTLYNYTPWTSSIYIRPIRKANDLYRGLGF